MRGWGTAVMVAGIALGAVRTTAVLLRPSYRIEGRVTGSRLRN